MCGGIHYGEVGDWLCSEVNTGRLVAIVTLHLPSLCLPPSPSTRH